MSLFCKYIALIVCFFSFQELIAQNSQISSGSNAYGSGGSSSYSIGQIVYSFNSNQINTTSEGNQQPFEIIVLSNEINEDINLNFFATPNPTNNFLNLTFDKDTDLKDMNYELFDINGKIITEKTKIDSYRQSIDFSCFSKGLYLIKISKNLKFVKTFKVIKN